MRTFHKHLIPVPPLRPHPRRGVLCTGSTPCTEYLYREGEYEPSPSLYRYLPFLYSKGGDGGVPGRRLGSYTSYLLLNPLPYCTEKGVRVVGAIRSLPRTEYSVRGHGEDKCILISLYFLFLLLTSLLNINCTRLLHCTGTVSFTVQVLYTVQSTEKEG